MTTIKNPVNGETLKLMAWWWAWSLILVPLLVAVSGSVIWGFEQINRFTLNQKHYSYWAEYYDVSPSSRSYKKGLPVKFISDLAIYRPVDLYWIDILYCRDKTDNDFTYYDTVTDVSYLTPVARKKAPWTWNGVVPSYPAECYLKSVISYRDPDTEIRKTQLINDPRNSFFVNQP